MTGYSTGLNEPEPVHQQEEEHLVIEEPPPPPEPPKPKKPTVGLIPLTCVKAVTYRIGFSGGELAMQGTAFRV
jgi:hypothetical protein